MLWWEYKCVLPICILNVWLSTCFIFLEGDGKFRWWGLDSRSSSMGIYLQSYTLFSVLFPCVHPAHCGVVSKCTGELLMYWVYWIRELKYTCASLVPKVFSHGNDKNWLWIKHTHRIMNPLVNNIYLWISHSLVLAQFHSLNFFLCIHSSSLSIIYL